MAAKQSKKRSSKQSKTQKSAAQTHLIFIERLLKLLVVVALAILIAIVSYFYGYRAAKDENRSALAKTVREKKKIERVLQTYQLQSALHEYGTKPPQDNVTALKKEEPKIELPTKPLMAIIVDDMSFEHDVRNVKALGIPVTMSFLPPSGRHPHSAELAHGESFYMVHLPLEAKNFNHEEPNTLHVGDSEAKIERRIERLMELYPKMRYVNNHTGSLFTEDMTSMRRLIKVLDRHGITFIDSRTTAKTVVPALMKSLHHPYISRDVFLDHTPDVEAIKKQVARAVKIAKKYGYAIAICHPHKKTLQGLREAKEDGAFDGVELVRIDTLVAHMPK